MEYAFDKVRYRLVVSPETGIETGNNPLAERVDLADVVVVLVAFGCSLMAGEEGEDGSVVRPCQLAHRGASSRAQGCGACQAVAAR